MNVVILGCGRVGARIAGQLCARHAVTVVDWNSAAFERLGGSFSGETMVGNGIDVDVQRDAGVEEADYFVALTNGDNRNLMAGEIALQLGAKRVIARLYDPVRGDIFSDVGIIVVSPTVRSAERLFELVTGDAGG
jgi:trk system potassium uptake protein TrkA